MMVDICKNDIAISNGRILFSLNQMLQQISCQPHTNNVGNLYSYSATSVGSNISSGYTPNSICPKGWKITSNKSADSGDINNLTNKYYDISAYGGKKILAIPLSFNLAGGYYEGNPLYRKEQGNYWSALTSNSLNAYYSFFRGSDEYYDLNGFSPKNYGYSLRYVSKTA